MRRALAAASLSALVFGVFCTTQDVDYDPADLVQATDGSSAGGTTSTTTSSSSGSVAPTCSGTVCTPRSVEAALILSFDGDGSAGAAGAANAGGLDSFGEGNAFSGGTFQYGDALTSTFEDDAWHLSGSAGLGSGFGLFLNCQSDASDFSGIEVTLRGDTGMQQINMLVETASNIVDACQGGTCGGGCAGAAAAVNHTTGEKTYTFLWEDFQDGSPDDMPDPSEITAIRWEFQAANPLPVDFYVDDIRFTQ